MKAFVDRSFLRHPRRAVSDDSLPRGSYAGVGLALLPVVSLHAAVWVSLAFAGVALVVAIWRGVRP